jgi:hypothetical protein
MKTALFLLLLAATAVGLMPRPAATTRFTATLSGQNEVPANNSTATGAFMGTYDSDSKVLRYEVTYQGLNPTMGHIHRGAPGKNGGVEIGFKDVSSSPIRGQATLTQAKADSLMAGLYYVNLHSQAFPGGEIRGNIAPAK